MDELLIGDISVRIIDGGQFRLDGGAMFGVIPRPLWERQYPTDKRNRIPMACNCLLLRNAGEYIIVETGCGDRFTEKEKDIFAIRDFTSLSTRLQAVGVRPDEIAHVILTHLHFDHAAGALTKAPDGSLQPAFTNADYWIQKREFEDAQAGRSIMRNSYVAADLQLLVDSGRTRFLEGDSEIVGGVTTRITGGHTAAHQIVVVESAGQTLLYPGDLIPTRAHLSPYWIMSYDMYPYDTLTQKLDLIDAAVAGEWVVVWDHDPNSPWNILRRDGEQILTENF